MCDQPEQTKLNWYWLYILLPWANFGKLDKFLQPKFPSMQYNYGYYTKKLDTRLTYKKLGTRLTYTYLAWEYWVNIELSTSAKDSSGLVPLHVDWTVRHVSIGIIASASIEYF